MRQEEYHIQVAVVRWLRTQYPKVLFTASAGGMRTSISTAKKMKAMGYRKGCPDLMIFEIRGDFAGAFIELKAPKGRASKEQIDFLADLTGRGYFTAIAQGFDRAVEVIDKYLKLKGE